ncbi:10211_t:CDS:2 [Paraglomus brasilianum]|uniref:Vacuolar protein sorting-associated protein 51 homolog n=1 Tax=Paraglomus brasilianum TaxID=144538 RepID=A0A9N8VJX2_9GLOM|nr:10211_t:CDS:2 [Paraglomus brasilianum]
MSLEKNSGDNSENISDNTSDPKVTASSNSDICQELKISASHISAKPKSLEEKEINSFLYEKNKESISNTIRERNREKKLRSQDLSCENNSLSIETSKTVAIIDKSSITTREPLSPIIQTQNTTPSKIAEASTSMLKIPYNQKIEQGIIQETDESWPNGGHIYFYRFEKIIPEESTEMATQTDSNPTSSTSTDQANSKNDVPSATSTSTRRRAKNLLRDYYGLGPDGKKADPLDIDNSAFEGDSYFSKLLVENNLSALMQRDNDLSTETRQLDGDMKTLVYENYSKFISATDTIRKMKSDVEKMESEMHDLTKSMANISEVCSSVNSALGPKREKIRQLTNIQNSLKRHQQSS